MNGDLPEPNSGAAETADFSPETDPARAAESAANDPGKKHWEQLVRTTADFENFKKRAARERQEAVQYANESLLQKLLPILDQFDMALAAAGQDATPKSMEALQTGISMTHQQLKKVMTEAGVSEVNAAGQAFDPNFHEAVAQLESEEIPEGHVLQQMRKGYKLRERLLRPAMVVVAKPPAR